MRNTTIRRLICVVALMMTAAACGDTGDSGSSSSGAGASQGISDDTIVIGTYGALTGDYAVDGVYIQGMKAHFEHINEQGGVTMADGVTRKIVFKIYDDAYDPARTLTNCREFVERDHGFAMVMILGTPTGLACQEYMNSKGVPTVLHHSSSQIFSTGGDDFPWQSGFPLTYTSETAIVAEILKDEQPNARVGMLRFAGDAGDEYYEGFAAAVEGSNIEIVSDSVYSASDTSVESHMAKILDTSPDVFLQFTSGAAVSQALKAIADSGQDISDFLVSTSATTSQVEPAGSAAATGVRSIQWAKDPSDLAYADDEEVLEFQRLVKQYGEGPGIDRNLGAMVGYIGAQIFVKALENSQPTAESLMEAIYSFDGLTVSGLLPGVTITTNEDDTFLIESGRESVYDGTSWIVGDELFSYEGRTPVLIDG